MDLSVFQIRFGVCAFSCADNSFFDIEDLSNIPRCVCVWVHIWTFVVWQFLQTDLLLGLKKTLYSFVQSLKRLSCVLVLTAFTLCIFATINLQSFMGALGQKCISLPVTDHNLTSDIFYSRYYDDQSSDFNYQEHVNNPSMTLWNVCFCGCVVDVWSVVRVPPHCL